MRESCDYHFVLELTRQDRTVIGKVPVTTDFEPAREWALFTAQRRGEINLTETGMDTRIEPLWHPKTGRPYLSGFRVKVGSNGVGFSDFPLSYWSAAAQESSYTLAEQGVLKQGEIFYFSVMAYPAANEVAEQPTLEAETVIRPICADETSLDDTLRSSLPFGPAGDGDMPVFIPSHILDEIEDLRREAGAVETGGVLLGRMLRDSAIPELFLQVTAQVPARFTRSQLTRLTFTAETWSDARAALELRRRNETLIGYWHSHPTRDWANGSKSETESASAGDFFSADDCALMRAVFWRPFSVGLVISDKQIARDCWTSSFALYGWRSGVIEARPFYLSGVRRTVGPVAHPASVKD